MPSENKKNKITFDFSDVVVDIEKMKAKKALTKNKKTTSVKKLKFETNEEDSTLKAEIIRYINERDLTYSDLYDYCTDIKGGDEEAGKRLGYNIIYGLRKHASMMDVTFSILCDFLGLEIILRKRNEDEE